MTTDREKNRRFRAARSAQLKRLPQLQKDTAAEVVRLLRQAEREILAQLASQPSDFQAWHLPNLQQAVRQALAEMERGAAARLGSAAGEAWAAGIDLVDQPIEAGFGGSLRISGLAPAIDTRPLMAMRAFMTDRMKDISTTVANRINAELGLAAIGAKSTSQATDAIAELVAGGRTRAIAIVRNELGRAWSIAAQERKSQAAERLPGLKKQWRRSGKIHSRPAHDIADGQVRAVDEPFLVDGIEIMFPRDPAAPPSETINCGCSSLPFVESWDMAIPGRKPFSAEELARSPTKRALESGLG